MPNKNILKLYNQFTRINSQFTVLKRNYVCNDYNEPIYPAEMQVLALLFEHPDYTISDIASHLYTTKSGASQLVKKLCSKGFLAKDRDPQNERIVILTLTTLGLKAVNNFLNNESTALGELGKLLSTHSQKEIKTIENFFNKIEESLNKKLELP